MTWDFLVITSPTLECDPKNSDVPFKPVQGNIPKLKQNLKTVQLIGSLFKGYKWDWACHDMCTCNRKNLHIHQDFLPNSFAVVAYLLDNRI